MDVMLVGGMSPMMRKLSLKLYKEGHRIFVLSGKRNPSDRYEHVFERYDFPYSADSVKEVFRSVNPDITILLGAFDSNLYEEDSRREAVEYAAGLQNVLLSWAALNKGRLIYLSSVEVYGHSYTMAVSEDVKPIPASMKSLLLLQAEESCRFYQERLERDVIILRIDRLYDVPKDKNEAALGICESKCLEAFRSGAVTYKNNYYYGLTYAGDAVESIYKLIACKSHRYGLYHISSSNAYPETQIINDISKALGKEPEKIDNTLEEQNFVILSNQRLQEEFGFDIRHTPAEIVQKTIKYMKRHSGSFLDITHPGLSLWRRLYYSVLKFLGIWFPYIENLVFFIPFFMLNNRATESQYFSKIDFYLIYVLLFAVVHGQRQATFSALLATAGYMFRQMYDKSGITVLTDYNTYVWIAEIFIVGLVVGYMKDKLNFIKEEDEQEVDFLSEQVTDISNINDSNLRVKEGLITQVVNYNDSLGTVYEMISRLGEDDPTKILFRAITIIKDITECPDVSIYRIDDHNYARLFGYTTEKAVSLGHTICLPDNELFYDAALKRTVFLNRNMDKNYPMMEYCVYEGEKPDLMIMLWSIPFERMTIAESNRLIVLGKLIQNAVNRTEKYLEFFKNERFSDGERVFKAEAFADLVETYREAKKRNMTEYTLLKAAPMNDEITNVEQLVLQTVYSTDYVGYGRNGALYILLSGTSGEEYSPLINRLKAKGIRAYIDRETAL